MLRLDDHWVWDFWFADDGERYHIFFLKAPKALGDPDLRHWNVRIGHAVSTDLSTWQPLPDAICPGATPAFDDYTTWTGSVVRADDGSWRMFYTGTSRAEGGHRQTVGMATSPDLLTWTKQGPAPVATSDPRWYEPLTDALWGDEAWRDPWVFPDPAGDGWHMLVTTRGNCGAANERGVVGHARSRDLVRWDAQPPLSQPGAGFGHVEVFQVAEVEGQWLLIFSCLGPELADERRAAGERGGIWLLKADGPLGPFDPARAFRLTDESLYAGRILQRRDGSWALFGFLNEVPGQGFVGAISDPIPFQDAIAHAQRGGVWSAAGPLT